MCSFTISESFPGRVRVDDHVVTYAATVLYPELLLFVLGNINTVVVVVYQIEPAISVALTLTPTRAPEWVNMLA